MISQLLDNIVMNQKDIESHLVVEKSECCGTFQKLSSGPSPLASPAIISRAVSITSFRSLLKSHHLNEVPPDVLTPNAPSLLQFFHGTYHHPTHSMLLISIFKAC